LYFINRSFLFDTFDNKGILTDFNNLNSTINTLQNAINNLEESRKIGLNASIEAGKRYNNKDMYQKYEVLYRKILSNRNLET